MSHVHHFKLRERIGEIIFYIYEHVWKILILIVIHNRELLTDGMCFRCSSEIEKLK
jgi:hypothetical protein